MTKAKTHLLEERVCSTEPVLEGDVDIVHELVGLI